MKRILHGGKMFNLILLVFATWRITSLIKDEDGPYEIFYKFRESIGLTEAYENNQRILISNGSLLADIVQCFWCLSIWTGYGIALLAVMFGLINANEFVFYGLALSAISILIEEKIVMQSELDM